MVPKWAHRVPLKRPWAELAVRRRMIEAPVFEDQIV